MNTGHVLVIPKRHSTLLSEMDEETGAHLFKIAMSVQGALRASSVRCEGINLFLADGEAAGQEVRHVHLHVFPRFIGDDFRLDVDQSHQPPREELDNLAAMIRLRMGDVGGS